MPISDGQMPQDKVHYLDALRELVGPIKLITPGVRALITDEAGRILLIRRRDNQRWALPAGGLELDESILDCLRREVNEETGLTVLDATVIAIYSEPRFSVINAAGEAQQKLTIVFHVLQWSGTLQTETEETIDARFFAEDDLPPLAPYHAETLEDLRQYAGRVVLK